MRQINARTVSAVHRGAAGITDNKCQRACLLFFAGEKVHDIFDTLAVDDETYEAAVKVLNDHVEPVTNTEYARFVFRKAAQDKLELWMTFTRVCSSSPSSATLATKMLR